MNIQQNSLNDSLVRNVGVQAIWQTLSYSFSLDLKKSYENLRQDSTTINSYSPAINTILIAMILKWWIQMQNTSQQPSLKKNLYIYWNQGTDTTPLSLGKLKKWLSKNYVLFSLFRKLPSFTKRSPYGKQSTVSNLRSQENNLSHTLNMLIITNTKLEADN